MCPLQVDLLSVTFDPETAEIRLLNYCDATFGSHYVATVKSFDISSLIVDYHSDRLLESGPRGGSRNFPFG